MLMPSSERGGGTNLRLLLRTGPIRQLIQRLLDNSQRLAHFLYPHPIAGIDIAIWKVGISKSYCS